jgi:hypothetical protein
VPTDTPNGIIIHPNGDISTTGQVAATKQPDGSMAFDPSPQANAFKGVLIDAIHGRDLPTPAHAAWAFEQGLIRAVGDNQRTPEGWAWRRDVLDTMLEPELEFVYLTLIQAAPPA